MIRQEQAIQKAIISHLRLRGVKGLVYWHTPNGGKRNYIEAAIFKSLGVRAGVSDLILVHQGKIFALELKAEDGRATESQMAFIQDMDREGAYTAICEGLDMALATLEAWGLLKPVVTMKSIVENLQGIS